MGINLGAANNYTIFALSDGVTIKGGTPHVVDVKGDIAAAGGNVTIYDYVIVQGNVYVKKSSNGKFTKLPQSQLIGNVYNQYDSTLSSASSSAMTASSNAFAKAATVALSNIVLNGSNYSLSGSGDTVLKLQNLSITNGTLTLSGNASTVFVFNISKSFNLDNGKIVLTGGLVASNVIFNVANTSTTVTLKNSSSLTGTILAPQTYVSIANSTVFGKVIGKKVDISGRAPSVVSP